MEKEKTSVMPTRDFRQAIETFLRNHDLREVLEKIQAITIQILKARQWKSQKERTKFAFNFATGVVINLKLKFVQPKTEKWIKNDNFDVEEYVKEIIESFKAKLKVCDEIDDQSRALEILSDSEMDASELLPAWEIHYGDPHGDMVLSEELRKFEAGEITETEKLIAASVIEEVRAAEFYVKTHRGFPWEILRRFDREHPLWILFIAVGPEIFRKICFLFLRRKVKTIHFPSEKTFLISMFTPIVLQLHKADPEMACHRIAQIVNESYSEEGRTKPYFPVRLTESQVRKIILDSEKQSQKTPEQEVRDLNKIAKSIHLKKLLKLPSLEAEK